MQKYTIRDFNTQFPDDDACLDWLRNYLYPNGIGCPKCERVTKHHRVSSRRSYSCDVCGHHVHPTADTIYHKSSTSLRLWFYATFLMASTRCGISAKQLERELGVTYKTAWRMFKQIRSMLESPEGPSNGSLEVDETFVGGKQANMHASVKAKRGIKGRGFVGKTPVMGLVNRETGAVVAQVIPDVTSSTLLPVIQERVMPESMVYTDEAYVYTQLPGMGYRHKRVNHEAKVYVIGDTHTNTIEGFWSLLKRGIAGVYHAVGVQYLQSYVDEYAFRYSHRKDATPMFLTFLHQVQKAQAPQPQ